MTPSELRLRTKRFALAIVRRLAALPPDDAVRIIARQLLRSSTSVAANYRAAGRARSRKEFAARVGVALEEADESLLWLEILKESRLFAETGSLEREATELVKIFSAAFRTSSRAARRPLDHT